MSAVPTAAERALRWPARESAVIAGALAVLVALAWWWGWQGAGTGMNALDMTALALFPHRLAGMDMGGMPFSWIGAVAMWWVMMIAMMTPGAAPLVLLHVRAVHHAQQGAPAAAIARPLARWMIAKGISAPPPPRSIASAIHASASPRSAGRSIDL